MTHFDKQLNVLFLTQVLPYPLIGGAKIRAYYMLRHLAQHHRLTLVSFVRDDDSREDIDHLHQFCETVYTVPIKRSTINNGRALIESVFQRRPLVILRDNMPKMESLLRELMETVTFDVVHADQTSMAQYAIYSRDIVTGRRRPRLLLDQHNALYLVVQRQARHERGWLKRFLWQREARLLVHYEAQLMAEFDEILTVTDNDRVVLLDLLDEERQGDRRERFTVVPICVDPTSQPLLPQNATKPKIIHLGTMFWPPNIEGVLWFANQVLPRIAAKIPDFCFVIAGKNPPPAILELAEDGSHIKEHVEITGYVADARPMLASSKAFVVPLLAGGGMRVKILDAWQWGLPIVSTTIGAEGISICPGENILVADEPQGFADAVIDILTNPELAARLRTKGRLSVARDYDWREVYGKVDEVYKRMV